MNLPFRQAQPIVEAADSEVDARVAAANPLPPERLVALLGHPELLAIRDEISSRQTASSPPRRPFWRRGARPFLLAGVLLMAFTGGVYGAWGAHTGWFGAPGLTESDTSEWLREDAADIVGVVDGFTAKYTLPPGGSWSGLRSTYPKPAGSGLIQRTGIEGEVSFDAYCQWQHYWIVGYDTQDAAKLAAAQAYLDQYPTLPITMKTSDPSAIAEWQQIAEFARTNQAGPLERLYALNCTGPGTQP